MFCVLSVKILCIFNYLTSDISARGLEISALWRESLLKHTTTLFALSDHYILSQEWRVIVDNVQTNYHVLLNICVVTGRANITHYERSPSIIKLKAAYHRAIIGLIT